jgi:hypothetical protein
MPGSIIDVVNGSQVLCWNGWGVCLLKSPLSFSPLTLMSTLVPSPHRRRLGFLATIRNTVTNIPALVFLSALENTEVITIGTNWCATGKSRLHIFTDPRCSEVAIVLDRRCLTMIGQHTFLFVVFRNQLQIRTFGRA